MNHKKTSPSVASKAARTLRSKSASRTQKKLAASALSQTRGTRKTGKKMEKVASAAQSTPTKRKLLLAVFCPSQIRSAKGAKV